jgi:hypothetical protein
MKRKYSERLKTKVMVGVAWLRGVSWLRDVAWLKGCGMAE